MNNIMDIYVENLVKMVRAELEKVGTKVFSLTVWGFNPHGELEIFVDGSRDGYQIQGLAYADPALDTGYWHVP